MFCFFFIYRYGVAKVKDKLTETITKVLNFIRSVFDRIKDIKPLHPANQLTSLMVFIALIVGGFLIGTIVNMANNPYSDWNTHAMWPIVIFSVLVSIFLEYDIQIQKCLLGAIAQLVANSKVY